MSPSLRVLLVGDDDITAACAKNLGDEGFTLVPDRDADSATALVFNPGLHTAEPSHDIQDPASDLVDRVTANAPNRGGHLTSVVAINTLDSLVSPTRPRTAARAGALTSAARSLGLALAPEGVRINTVIVNPRGQSEVEQPAGPRPLLPEPLVPEHIARAVTFFLHPRSRYITGQVCYVDGGSSLLSSLSV